MGEGQLATALTGKSIFKDLKIKRFRPCTFPLPPNHLPFGLPTLRESFESNTQGQAAAAVLLITHQQYFVLPPVGTFCSSFSVPLICWFVLGNFRQGGSINWNNMHRTERVSASYQCRNIVTRIFGVSSVPSTICHTTLRRRHSLSLEDMSNLLKQK